MFSQDILSTVMLAHLSHVTIIYTVMYTPCVCVHAFVFEWKPYKC